MASMQLNVTMVGGSSTTITATVSDADAVDLVSWVLATYPKQFDAQGMPITRDGTWAVRAWFEGEVAEGMSAMHQWKQAQAASVAAAAVQAPVVTVT